MTPETEIIDVTNWRRDYHDDRHPFWWGIIILILIEMTVVLGFVSSFFYSYISHLSEASSWFPSQPAPILLPSINTVLLFLCALSMYYGGVVMDKGKQMYFFYLVIFCCIASGIILYLRWLQLDGLPFDWKESSYASFVWTMSGFHFVHLTSALIGTAVIGYFSYKGYYDKERQLGIQVDTMYWYFVFIAWIPMYFTLYILPRLVS